MLKSAIVFGWGAVEQKAAQWAGVAVEMQPRLWYVYSADNVLLGVIGKEPWTASAVQRMAEDLAPTAPTPSKE